MKSKLNHETPSFNLSDGGVRGNMKAIIVDIDGTLSDASHRQHFVQQNKKDWKSFYDGIPNDKPNQWCKDLIRRYIVETESTTIILLSGRPDNYRFKTIEWLNNNNIGFDYLYMREAGDYRQDYIVKKEIYETYIKRTYEIIFVIDDRKQVVDMWRKEGLVCLQCAEGNF